MRRRAQPMVDPGRIEIRAVLGGAYLPGTDLQTASLLHHAVLCNESDGREIRVLCNRVKLDSLADSRATDAGQGITCPRCLRALERADISAESLVR